VAVESSPQQALEESIQDRPVDKVVDITVSDEDDDTFKAEIEEFNKKAGLRKLLVAIERDEKLDEMARNSVPN